MKLKGQYLLIFAWVAIITQIFTSCEKEISSNNGWNYAKNYSDTLASVDQQIYARMKDHYLWYDSIPTVNTNNFGEPQIFLNSLKNWRDKWSFILTRDEYMAEFVTGAYFGHGFAYKFDAENKMRILYVFNNTDMHDAGVRRGWIIKQVNGNIPDSINAENIFGPSAQGVQNIFTFTRPDGKDTTLIFTKKEIIRNTVLAYDTLHIDNKIVGYISFLAFELDADVALENAINYFMMNNVTELVLDLRYNGGGSVSTAQNLASMLAGPNADGKIFVNYTFNRKDAAYNESSMYGTPSVYINLSRLFVITTNGTASASELVINSLRGIDLPVYLIGSQTDGKPVGMMQFLLNYNYYLYPITFKTTNAKNYGDYYNGLTVDQQEDDDITHDFGDRNEACMSQALHYIQFGSFVPTTKSTGPSGKIYRERPSINYMIK